MRSSLPPRKRSSTHCTHAAGKFYTFIGGAARIMFSWDTDLARVDALLADLKECAAYA